MNIAIVGTGYVGLVTGTCFAEMGVNVACVDIDKEKISNLNNGIIPIYEPGLEELVKKNTAAGRLKFTDKLPPLLDNAEVVFCAVGTPPDEDGSADLRYVLDVARTIGQNINKYILIVTKSTVPVGTAAKIKVTVNEELNKRGVSVNFDVASNPEFLKEGSAVKDFMTPDRVVVGTDSDKAKDLMEKLYKPFTINHYRMIFTDIPSAEMIKYAANAMLATRISFMNDIANLCRIVGANVDMVRRGIGSDSRIGSKFLYPGCGYGGSCFPKDVKALINTAAQNEYTMKVLKAVEEVNMYQKTVLFKRLQNIFGKDFQEKNIALWGLSFKPETDDMREAPALVMIDLLLNQKCNIKVYDPVAIPECKRRLGNKVQYAKDIYDAAENADAILMLTEWKEFRMPDWKTVKLSMKQPIILDGRNIYDRTELQAEGFVYENI
ncbi:MAG: UDP-glucose/GDP-mannose dehydrogenase family protein [Dysgonamonadaceae bacterium]|jgi:UDPglucose 6-dehydrogenase|nr:UDP-glucose/GDP-mannose dehydrogenase family protein [Dysgonamonadaceae bacterium]